MSVRPTQLPPPGEVVELRDTEVPDFLERHRVALLAFLDPGEVTSQRMRARLEVVAAKLSASELGTAVVDVRRDRLVAEAVAVKAVPTVIVFVGGEMVDRLMGAAPESVLEEMLAAPLAGRFPPTE